MKVVLLPGLDGTGELFKPFVEALPKELDVVIISYPTDEHFNYSELIEFVIPKLPSEDYILIGESFSGYIAYQIALRHSAYLKKVIFVATFLEAPHPYLLGASKLLPRETILSFPIPSLVSKVFLFGNSIGNELIEMFNDSVGSVSPEVLSSRLNEISKLSKPNQSCETEAIYIQASNDKLVPKESVEIFKQLFINLTVHTISGSHFILQGNPEACAKTVAGSVAL